MVQMFNTQSVQIGNEINLQLIQAHKKWDLLLIENCV